MSEQKFYHATTYNLKGTAFYPNEQGLHLASTIEGAMSVMEDRSKGKKSVIDYDIYEVDIPFQLNSIKTNFDLYYWSPSEIARIILLRLQAEDKQTNDDDKKFKSISGVDVYPTATFENDPIIQPIDDIQMDISNFTDTDASYLLRFIDCKDTMANLARIYRVLKSKGYNSIQYPLKEDKNNTGYCLVIFEPVEAILSSKHNDKLRDYKDAQDMIDLYKAALDADDDTIDMYEN